MWCYFGDKIHDVFYHKHILRNSSSWKKQRHSSTHTVTHCRLWCFTSFVQTVISCYKVMKTFVACRKLNTMSTFWGIILDSFSYSRICGFKGLHIIQIVPCKPACSLASWEANWELDAKAFTKLMLYLIHHVQIIC